MKVIRNRIDTIKDRRFQKEFDPKYKGRVVSCCGGRIIRHLSEEPKKPYIAANILEGISG